MKYANHSQDGAINASWLGYAKIVLQSEYFLTVSIVSKTYHSVTNGFQTNIERL